MKERWSIVVVLAAVLLALAFAGGSWNGAVAQTVPEEPQPMGFGTFFGGQGVYNASGFGEISGYQPSDWNRGRFLRQPLYLEFNPEGFYVYVIFSLNDREMEMMADGELCMGFVEPWMTYPLSYSTTAGQVYAYVPGFTGYYGLAECP